ncbi:MAG: hypothetical protein VYE27_05275 [Pseudomonadota bacterium]|nr:hypothetical protein [Pseudomonadota bacterium]
MCSSCGYPEVSEYWADFPASRESNPLRDKLERLKKLSLVLDRYGLTCDDGGAGYYLQIGNKMGRTELVLDLEGLWQEAENMLGKPIDPLDVGFHGSNKTRD